MEHPVLGIDIGKSKFHVHLLLPDGKARPKVLANNAQGHKDLLDWLKKLGDPVVLACMEGTGSYGKAVAYIMRVMLSVWSTPPALKATQ
jgi:transposase